MDNFHFLGGIKKKKQNENIYSKTDKLSNMRIFNGMHTSDANQSPNCANTDGFLFFFFLLSSLRWRFNICVHEKPQFISTLCSICLSHNLATFHFILRCIYRFIQIIPQTPIIRRMFSHGYEVRAQNHNETHGGAHIWNNRQFNAI